MCADELLRHCVEPLLKGGGQAVVSVTAPAAPGMPALLTWDDPAPGQVHNPEACCQKVGRCGEEAA